jgi:hypothetical protein
MGGSYKSYDYDFRERDAQLQKLYSRVSIAKAQNNKHLRIALEKEIRAIC